MKGKKEITIYDIAETLNISASTVSRGLRNHPSIRKNTKDKILHVAREMGYQHNTFASSLRKKRTNTIGVVLPRLDSYFQSTVISGMEKIANKRGYNLIISQSQESALKEMSSITTMYNSRTDGLLISLAYDTENLDHFQILFNKEIPVIFFDRVIDHPNCTSIVIDNFKAGYDATYHLIEQGCKNIVYVGGNLKCNVYHDRYKGYRQALTDNGLNCDNRYLIINKLNEGSSIEATQKILAMNNLPDGIFAANDTSAVTMICHLKKAGVKIPEEIGIVGFNNNPISKVVEPNLSTIDYPGQEMGEVAATTLIDILKNTGSAKLNTIVLHHELIVRESSLRKYSVKHKKYQH